MTNIVLTEHVDVVDANVPFFIDLDLLDKYQMPVNIVKIFLQYPYVRFNVPLSRKRVHIYV